MSRAKKLKDITLGAYCITHTPAYDWLLSVIVASLQADDLDQLIVQSADLKNK